KAGGTAFALFEIDSGGLDLLRVTGASASTAGAYSLHIFVAGDANQDGTVNGNDAAIVAAALGTSAGQPGYVAAADADQSGTIDAFDGQLLAQDLGFIEVQPPSVTASQALTHVNRNVVVDLAPLATDPQGEQVFFNVIGADHGTATLDPDGHTVTFVPDTGYSGPADFQYEAADQHARSAPATVSVNVSAAPLVRLDFAERAPRLDIGSTVQMTVVADYADETGVVLTGSDVTFQVSNTTVATVSPSGMLNALNDGTTVLS